MAVSEFEERALRAEALVEVMAQALDHIAWVVQHKQPDPRSASVTYVAGYARAMDDVRRALLESGQNAARGAQAVEEAQVIQIVGPVPQGPGTAPQALPYRDTGPVD